MRISDQMKFREVTSNLQTNLRGIDRAQSQISSGKRIQKASEDPNAAAAVIPLASSLRGLEQFRRNVDSGTSRVSAEETVLDQLGDALARARELAVSQAGDTANATTRAQTKQEVDKLLDFAVQLGNTRFGENHLFGGFAAETPPLAADGTLTNPGMTAAEQHRVEIAAGQQMNTNHNAREVFVDSGTTQALRDLSAALGADDSAGIQAAMGNLVTASDNVQGLLGDVGGRYNQLQVTRSSLEALDFTLTSLRSELEDAEIEKVTVELVSRQTAFQSAMLATSRILGMNLADYLR